MENPIIYETNTTIDKYHNQDSVESKLHRMEEAIIANNNVQKASLLCDNGVEASSGFESSDDCKMIAMVQTDNSKRER